MPALHTAFRLVLECDNPGMGDGRVLYDDGHVVCDDIGIRIRWYYPWGAKTIPYGAIRGVEARPLNRVRGRWRLWGSGDFTHWYNLDLGRPGKSTALELDVGGRVVPTITPDEPETVARIVTDHLPGNA